MSRQKKEMHDAATGTERMSGLSPSFLLLERELSSSSIEQSIVPNSEHYFLRPQKRSSFRFDTRVMDFDDFLPMIGEFGLFQKYLYILLIPFCVAAASVYVGQIFITLPAHEFYCFVDELNIFESEAERIALSIPKEPDGAYSKCLMYDANYSDIRATKPNMENSTLPKVPCKDGYIYNSHVPYFSAAMEFNWVCGDEYFAALSQIVYLVGSIVGCVFYGYYADRIGRLPVFISSAFIGFTGNCVTSLVTSPIMFMIARLLTGFAYDTCFTMAYLLVIEYVGPSYRTFVSFTSMALFYSPFTCVLPWLSKALKNWQRFTLVSALPLGFGLFSYCIGLPESARWLVSRGQFDEAIDILRHISKVNNHPVPEKLFDKFKDSCQNFHHHELEYRNFTIFSIFKRGRLCRHMILLIAIWMVTSLVYDGHLRAASVLGNNIYVTFTWACAVEIPGNFLLLLTLDRVGCRWFSFVSTTLCGVFTLIAAHLTHPSQMVVAVIVGRFFASICHNIGLQWAAEMLPTVVRAQGISLIHTLGFVARLMSPLVVLLSNFSKRLMLTILGVLAVIGGLLALLLPETLHSDLPQTLDEGNEFGKDHRPWHMPCCGSGAKRRQNQSTNSGNRGANLRSTSRDEFRSKRLHRVTDITQNSPRFVADNEASASILSKIYLQKFV